MTSPTLAAQLEHDTSGSTTLTTGSFAVQAGDVIVVKGVVTGSGSMNTPAASGLTFTLRKDQDVGSQPRVYIWTAVCPSTTSITVTLTTSSNNKAFQVNVWRNATLDTTPVTIGAASGTAPNQSLTTTGTDSVIDWIVSDWNEGTATAPTFRTGGGTAHDEFKEKYAGAWTWWSAYNDATGAAGAKTIGWTAPTGIDGNIAAIEVKYQATGDTTAPTVPANLAHTLTGGGYDVSLTWDDSTDDTAVTGYTIYRGGVNIGTSATSDFVDSGRPVGTYTYTVDAYDAAGNHSAQTSGHGVTVLDVTAPSVPTGLGHTLSGGYDVVLDWANSTDNVAVTGYRVWRDGVSIATPAASTYTDPARPVGSYSYTVEARDAAGNWSGVTSAHVVNVVDVTAPSVPTGVGHSVAGYDVTITWTASTDNVAVTNYTVRRDGVALSGLPTGTSKVDTALAPGVYQYTVRANDAAGNSSAYTANHSVTVPDITAPSTPTGLSAAPAGSTVQLNWDDATDNVAVTGYVVQRDGVDLGPVPTSDMLDTGLAVGTYSYTVRAYDAAGNASPQSSPAVTAEIVPPPPVASYGGQFDIRLIAYAPNGASMGPLPTPAQFDIGMPLNDVPSFRLDYDLAAPRSALVGQPVELALEVSTDDRETWTEPPNARFLYLRDGRDPTKPDPYSADGPGYIWALTKARVLPDGTEFEGKRTFEAMNPGEILDLLFSEAQFRDAMEGFSWDFSTTADSAGRPWPTTTTVKLDLGQDYLAVLISLADAGLVDFRTQGRTVQLFISGSGNLLPNAIPEGATSLTTGWTAQRLTLTTASGYLRGTISDAALGTSSQHIHTPNNTLPVVPGQLYRATGEVRASASLPMSMRIGFYTSAGTLVDSLITGPQTATNPTTFVQLNHVEAFAPPGADYIQVTPGSDGTTARTVGDTIDFRNLSLTSTALMAGDQSYGDYPVVLRYGRDVTEAPFRRTWEALANYAYVRGDDGSHAERTNALAAAPWGRWEAYVTGGGIGDAGTLSVLGDQVLSTSGEARTEYTRGLVFERAVHMPLRDYHVGHYIQSALDGDLAPERMRVVQLTLGRDSGGMITGNVVLGDRFSERDILTARAIAKLTGGVDTQGGSGSPPTPEDSGTDLIAPGQVQNVAGSSTFYEDSDGAARAQVTLNWDDLTVNADASTMTDLDSYEVWRSDPGSGEALVGVTEAGTSVWSDSPYVPGDSRDFRVRAVDQNGNKGAFSAIETVVMAADTTAPGTPSGITLSNRLGVLLIDWDGTLAGGTPADFARLELHVGTTNLFTGTNTTMVGALFGPGVYPVPNLTYGATYYVRGYAVDKSGNHSAGSTTPSTTIPQIANGDIGSLAADKITTGVLSAILTMSGTIRTAASGARWEIDSTGIRAFDGVDANPTFQATSGGDVTVRGDIETTDYVEAEAGVRLSSMDSQVPYLSVLTDLGANTISTEEMILQGRELTSEWFRDVARGARRARPTIGTNTVAFGNTEIPLFECGFGAVEAGRSYKFEAHGNFYSGTANTFVDFRLRYTNDGTAPTISSGTLDGTWIRPQSSSSTAASNPGPFYMIGYYFPTADYDNIRVIMTGRAVNSGATAIVINDNIDRTVEMVMMDVGSNVTAGANIKQLSPTTVGSSISRKTKTYAATWSRSFDSAGAARTPDTNDMYFGQKDVASGNVKSMVGFPYSTIAADLSGSTIISISAKFRVKFAGDPDGTVLDVGEHNATTRPSTFSSTILDEAEAADVRTGYTKTVVLPNTVGNNFRAGTAKGLTLGPADTTALSEYGYVYGYGSTNPPTLTITYEN